MNPSTGLPTAPQMTGIMPTINKNPMGNYGDSNNMPTESMEPKETKGNWLTRLLPTIGSVGLPMLAGALLAPETGGLSLIAAAGLSGAGAAGGKAAQNAAEGKQVLDDSVLNEGIMGTVGGVAGGVAGKALGKAGGMLAGRAESIAGKKAATTAAEDAIETVANTYKDISPQLQKTLKAKDSLAHVTNLGYDIADPSNLVHVSNTSNDILNDVLNRALANSGPVDLSHYPDLIKTALAKEGGTLGSYEKVALARGRLGNANNPASKLLQQLEDIGAGVAKSSGDPNELRTLTTRLGELAADAKPSVSMVTGAVDPQQKAIYNVINEVRGQVKNALYERPEVAKLIKDEVGNIIPDEAMNIKPELADYLNNIITKSSKPQEILDEISKNINIEKLGKEGLKVGNIVTSTGGKARAAMEAGLSNPGPDVNPFLAATSGVSPDKGAIGNISSIAKNAVNNPAILDTLGRIGKMGEKLLPIAGGAAGTLPNLQANPTMQSGNNYSLSGGSNGTMGGNMINSTNGAHDFQALVNAMEAQAVLAPSMGGGASSFLSQIAPQLQKNQLALSAINAIPQGFANAGGAQGTGGILTNIAGLVPGTAAHAYNRQKQAAAAQLAAAMGITPDQAMGLLPNVMQNDQTAGMTQGILAGMGGQLAY